MHGPISKRLWSVSSLVVGASRWEYPFITELCSCFVWHGTVLWFFALHRFSLSLASFSILRLPLFTVRGPPRLFVCLSWPHLPPGPRPSACCRSSVCCMYDVLYFVYASCALYVPPFHSTLDAWSARTRHRTLRRCKGVWETCRRYLSFAGQELFFLVSTCHISSQWHALCSFENAADVAIKGSSSHSRCF